ncbi:formate acetyltransferase [Alkalihalobacillus alcalophilus ATCC 27647 = CGMCC 1.3604]|uniref:Formate acetyltransferase n=1 Tax=Alkalihalobacillus alcalophilus ATCC 27647 = CGMCC 1.3604 TaxID=1218173 RepID=A0A094WIS2_ALKAL|nr:formate C-acetyltransferase [Alkalihalobacillus alcalophilus]KGA95828.1 formate acetyltransferase [Alkalihalobacillus alcalophilus ATCC 27647 = CGMCC 1.3604]MED1562949.1 formate C-acetyltransferase [Alkalihalobacillus alcalophilus]THG91958.1 formate acetyltransferase [Alkalihalobacillus alcalophilus ATCC 27647 = CGMCC 1.3604]
MEQWHSFRGESWKKEVDVRDFILTNVSSYDGDEGFLEGATEATKQLWQQIMDLTNDERLRGGVYDLDTKMVSTIISHGPGYLNQSLEKIVGLQTDEPFKRSLMPFGGIRMAETAATSYGYQVDEEISEIFTKYRKTHNQGVFDAYTDEMKKARKAGIITGLPDAYGRGRIIGDYRRVALYGVDFLIQQKIKDKKETSQTMTEEQIRLREELAEQIRALEELKELGTKYGFDLSKPATNAKEAFQWLYLAYLAAIKEQNGAAMSLGRVSTFLDIFIERDLKKNLLSEKEVQELVDHFVMKLRLVKFARTPEYNELFSGDPTWVTESIAGMSINGQHLVTKNSFRFLHTLENLGPAPEPNLTVLWSTKLPAAFKAFCAKMSIRTSAIQYENDDLMRPEWGDDYGIACCVSAMRIGKQMQFFGARANLAKTLLYAINGGVDEKLQEQVGPKMEPVTSDILHYEEVAEKFEVMMEWLAELYINSLNIIHYMHDKYSYERIEMALHDTEVLRTMATGIAGLSVVTDSLSAIKHSKVHAIRDEKGMVIDYYVEGDYPTYGNNDERVDAIAVEVVKNFMNKLKKYKTYRDSKTTTSVLTITSNVVYGQKTGNTPDGRRAGEPFAPGANPMHGRDRSGALASLSSVAKIPYHYALDGVSNTFSIVPKALGKESGARVQNLVAILDGYIAKGGHHLNINVFNQKQLIDAMEHPENYPQLTIRVSGYAVNFIKLTKEQQLDVINRTFHGAIAEQEKVTEPI